MNLPTEWQQPELAVTQQLSSFEGSESGGGVDIWGILLRRFWIVLLGLILAIGLGYIYLIQATPIYESIGQVLIEDKSQPSSIFEWQSLGRTSTNESKHVIMLQSPAFVSDTFRKHDLGSNPSFKGKDEGIAIGEIIKNLAIEPVSEGSDIFVIKYRSTSADDAPLVVAALLSEYRLFLEKTREDGTQEATDLFQEASMKLETELEDIDRQYADLRRGSQFLMSQDGVVNPHHSRMLSIEHKQTEVQLRISELSSRREALKAALLSETSDKEALKLLAMKHLGRTDRVTVSLAERLLPLIVELEDLSQKYGPGHRHVKSVKRRIEATKMVYRDEALTEVEDEAANDEIVSYLTNYLSTLEQQVGEARQELGLLALMHDEERTKAKALDNFTTQEETLRSKRDRIRKMYGAVVQKFDEIEMVKDVEGYRYKMLASPATGEKVEPTALKVFSLSGVLGLLGGFGIAYLVDLADKGFRNPDEVSKTLRLPVIGHVPLMDLEKTKTLVGSKIAPVICAVHRPKSPMAEAFRSVRTALYFNTRGQHHQVIQVTSPTPGDGKSTLAANVAVTIAQSGKSVLLLDADFRRPTLHKVFGLSSDLGLASVVQKTAEPDEATQSVEGVPNLFVMACGPRPDNPSELLSSGAFHDVLEMLREKFEFVIVDTPPLLAVTDPSAIAARVDGVIMTFRIDKRARPLTIRARDMLVDMGAEVIGVVVNGVSERHGYGYGYGGYKYQYGYGGSSYGYGGGELTDPTGIHKYFLDDTMENAEKPRSKKLMSAAHDEIKEA